MVFQLCLLPRSLLSLPSQGLASHAISVWATVHASCFLGQPGTRGLQTQFCIFERLWLQDFEYVRGCGHYFKTLHVWGAVVMISRLCTFEVQWSRLCTFGRPWSLLSDFVQGCGRYSSKLCVKGWCHYLFKKKCFHIWRAAVVISRLCILVAVLIVSAPLKSSAVGLWSLFQDFAHLRGGDHYFKTFLCKFDRL